MENSPNLNCIILAAGRGTRMKSKTNKVLHPLAGKPLVTYVIDTALELGAQNILVVTAPDAEDLRQALSHTYPDVRTVIQDIPQGTGDAVKAALPLLPRDNKNSQTLILLGDMPLLEKDTLEQLIQSAQGGFSVLGVHLTPPPAFGRLVQNSDGTLDAVIEDKDCTEEQRRITLCNTGAFCLKTSYLHDWLPMITNNNAQKEYYITDLVSLAAEHKVSVSVTETYNAESVQGVNTRADLAKAEQVIQNRLRHSAMLNGATLIAPETVTLCHDTRLGQDVVIEPHVVFGLEVRIENDVTIKSFSYLEGVNIKSGAIIGPSARIRPGTVIGENSKIGCFVDLKKASLENGVKISHLAYIGDANVGANTNIGCGAVTANYDGYNKHKTTIGQNVMIGCNVNLVAPVTIADDSYVAAGSTITSDIPQNALAVAREKSVTIKEGWASDFKNKQQDKG